MERILISRTDSIGDVVLTLPLSGLLKSIYPDCEVHFLGSSYTEAVVHRASNVDHFLNWQEIKNNSRAFMDFDTVLHVFPNREVATLAKKAAIPTRIGTSHRIFHWWTCNKLVHFSRKKSSLLEAQLNTKLLQPLGYSDLPSPEQLAEYIGWVNDTAYSDLLPENDNFNLILHMKSKGSAAEWPLPSYLELARLIPKEVNLILTGTHEEGEHIRSEIPGIFDLPNIQNTIGKLTLEELVALIGASDGLLACSTGPLHIAAVSGIHALGLYPNIKPMDAGRWGPIGKKAEYLEGSVKGQYLDIRVKVVQNIISKWLS